MNRNQGSNTKSGQRTGRHIDTGNNSGQHQRDQAKESSSGGDQKRERPKRESIIDLTKFLDKKIHIKFQGGREITGILKGFDHLLNSVLDNAVEFLRDPEDPSKLTGSKRNIGMTVCRGPAITVICPQGHEPIENPFLKVE